MKRGNYSLGRTAVFASQADQRFSYCLYVPPQLEDPALRAKSRLLVAVHGSERGNQALRDLFVPIADELNIIVLLPLFPCCVGDPLDQDNYKYIEHGGVRYDRVLLSIVDEVRARYRPSPERFFLFGFSGGAHFSHRFLYLHPDSVAAVSACAPGSPTLLDLDQDWWVGVRDFEQQFGQPLDLEAIRRVPVHLAVGTDDIDPEEITHSPGSPRWMPGANDSGATRVERTKELARSMKAAGLHVHLDLLPSARHEQAKAVAAAESFFRSRLSPCAAGATPRVPA